MAFFNYGTLLNSTLGAGVGAGLGYMNTGDMEGALGGTVAGGLFGGIGGGTLANRASRGVLARVGSFGKTGSGINRAGYLEGIGNGMMGFAAKNGLGPRSYMARAGAAMGTAGNWIGKNRVAVNKWGSRIATAAGLGAASYIGSSLISSNNGY